ncbi:MAG TPA: hypothetical protein VI701_04850 [Anaerolineales bacterium]|nr:hypothetical protein [Anaerolineales bacterium]
MDFIDLMAVIGYFLRLLGALVFGIAAGWLALQAMKPEGFQWPLAASVTVGLFLTFALIGGWVEGGGTLGAFGLGAGGVILIWPAVTRANAESGKKKAPPTRRR